MMAKRNQLNARRVAAAGPGRHYDGGGLHLYVRPSGSRSWVFRYRWRGRRRELGLGPWPVVTLARARELALQCRRLVAEGTDPMLALRGRAGRIPTFEEAARAFIEAHAPAWSNSKHAWQWRRSLELYAFPVLGNLPVDAIETPQVMQVLAPIWSERTETAKRLRGRMERILSWCAVQGLRSRENPAAWRGHLDALLPSPAKVAPVVHRRALPWREVPAFMEKLRQKPGMAARALEFAILTAARSGEVRGARWPEIDFETRTWRVPGDRMKSGQEHRVPLADQVLELLRALPRVEGSEQLFPSPIKAQELSDMALLKVCRDLGVDATPHGFRSSFRDWAAEATSFPRELAEVALAHRVAGKTEAAYWRSDLFEKRRALMEAWASFCTTQGRAAADVVHIGEAR